MRNSVSFHGQIELMDEAEIIHFSQANVKDKVIKDNKQIEILMKNIRKQKENGKVELGKVKKLEN